MEFSFKTGAYRICCVRRVTLGAFITAHPHYCSYGRENVYLWVWGGLVVHVAFTPVSLMMQSLGPNSQSSGANTVMWGKLYGHKNAWVAPSRKGLLAHPTDKRETHEIQARISLPCCVLHRDPTAGEILGLILPQVAKGRSSLTKPHLL